MRFRGIRCAHACLQVVAPSAEFIFRNHQPPMPAYRPTPDGVCQNKWQCLPADFVELLANSVFIFFSIFFLCFHRTHQWAMCPVMAYGHRMNMQLRILLSISPTREIPEKCSLQAQRYEKPPIRWWRACACAPCRVRFGQSPKLQCFCSLLLSVAFNYVCIVCCTMRRVVSDPLFLFAIALALAHYICNGLDSCVMSSQSTLHAFSECLWRKYKIIGLCQQYGPVGAFPFSYIRHFFCSSMGNALNFT